MRFRSLRSRGGDSNRTPLQTRVAVFAATAVAAVVVITAMSVYLIVQHSLSSNLDAQLQDRVQTIARSGAVEGLNPADFYTISSLGRTDLRVALLLPDNRQFSFGAAIPIGATERGVAHGEQQDSIRSADGYRIAASRSPSGITVVLAQSLAREDAILRHLGLVLLIVGSGLIVFAAAAGFAVARTGLRPVSRLRTAADTVARTGDLRPIAVAGNDELADLARSFNDMLFALDESRGRQRRLVADAGVELSTPLTSLRTNLELLIASGNPGAPQMDPGEREEIFTDVLVQMDELTELVNDLVELAREDKRHPVGEDVDLAALVGMAVERIRSRHTDTPVEVTASPATVRGDGAALERAVVNLLDSAVKRNPPGAPVSVELAATTHRTVDLVVADRGVTDTDRDHLFDRLAGSGLRLAIVAQVATIHGGAVRARARDGGGTVVTFTVPCP